MGKQPEVFNQLQLVNNWTHKQVVEHVAEAFEQYAERSKHQWKLDLSILSAEPFNLTITEGKRIFEKPYKYKKKRKKIIT